jgi:hypothetical protein
MDWKEYEKEITAHFKKQYPDCTITYDTTIIGRYSKVSRQIDVLIENTIADNEFRIFIDAKYFSKPIDVKQVETILGMMDDIAVDKGLIITKEGYTPAALKRAFFDPRRLELDVLNFKDLGNLQGFSATIYDGKHGALIEAPFGWIIDSTRRQGLVATLYQRGLSFKEANEQFEIMYLNIIEKNETHPNLKNLIDYQEEYTKESYEGVEFEYKEVKYREKESVILRTIIYKHMPIKEYTAFIDFEEFILFGVLLTSEVVSERNQKKLKALISTAIPIKMQFKDKVESALFNLSVAFDRANSLDEKIYIAEETKKVFEEIKDQENTEKYEKIIIELKNLA